MTAQAYLKAHHPKLFAPISLAAPCGTAVHRTVMFDQIKDMQSAEITHGKTVDWSDVEKRCVKILQKHAKDLQVMAWLTEAWVRTSWMTGLHHGLTLIHHFVQHNWDDLYPRVTADDDRYRLAPFLWIDQKLVPQLRLFPLSGDGLEGGYLYGDWVKTRQVVPERVKQEKDPLSSVKIIASLMLFGREHLEAQAMLVRNNLATLKELNASLTGKGVTEPLLGKLHKTLRNILSIYSKALLQLPQAITAPPVEEIEAMPNPTNRDVTALAPPLLSSEIQIKNRAHAYALLGKIADYLQETEPHSPTPYLIKRALGWGELSLGHLLMDLFQSSGGNLPQILAILGLGEATTTTTPAAQQQTQRA